MDCGCGAVVVSFVKSIEDVIWEDIVTLKAIWILKVEKFGPFIMSQDTRGKKLYKNH